MDQRTFAYCDCQTRRVNVARFLHNSKFITLMALGPILKQMTAEDLNDEALLKLPPMNITYNEKTTAITSVSFSQ